MKILPAIALLVLVIASLALVVLPSYLVSPMRSQTSSDLELSYMLARLATPLSMVSLVVGLILAVMIWRRPKRRLRGKIAVVIACGALVFFANATRGYMAEEMFTPLPEIVRVTASGVTHVLPEDLVLGVKQGGEAAAYPLPIIGYHHIVNDRLAGEPFVVTY